MGLCLVWRLTARRYPSRVRRSTQKHHLDKFMLSWDDLNQQSISVKTPGTPVTTDKKVHTNSSSATSSPTGTDASSTGTKKAIKCPVSKVVKQIRVQSNSEMLEGNSQGRGKQSKTEQPRPGPFQCEERGKSFSQSTTLATYTHIHTGE